jgi:hypothetical protein
LEIATEEKIVLMFDDPNEGVRAANVVTCFFGGAQGILKQTTALFKTVAENYGHDTLTSDLVEAKDGVFPDIV